VVYALKKLMLVLLTGFVTAPVWAAHGLGMGYEPKYKAGFQHFDYVNPNAPKGGKLVLSASGSFDKLNPFTLKGRPPAGMGYSGNGFIFAEYGLLFDALTTPSEDEPFSRYGLLAQDIQLAADKLSVTFTLNPAAKFSNGQDVLAADVKFTYDTLMGKQASPVFRSYWVDIKEAVVVSERVIRFDFKRQNSELHMVIGQLPIFSREWVSASKVKSFDELVTHAPIASGPYSIDKVDYGKSITYKRRSDYWAANLPVRKGMFNYDEISYQYFRDKLGEEEALKAGELDALEEGSITSWVRKYKGKRFDSGELVKGEIDHRRGTGMQALVVNLRREKFQSIAVREALELAFDFDWLNQRLFYNRRARTQSFFQNTDDLMASAVIGEDEYSILNRLKNKNAYSAQVSNGLVKSVSTDAKPEALRQNLIKAQTLLKSAGWNYKQGALRNSAGQAFTIQVDIADRNSEVVLSPYARNLAKLGIELKVKLSDSSLVKKRLDDFDFDMAVNLMGGSSSPGNELYDDFGSKSATEKGSQNMSGLQDKVVDELIEEIVNSPDRKAIAAGVKLLDRYLLSLRLGVPMYYGKQYFIAHKAHLLHPEKLPPHMLAGSWMLTMWWSAKK
jgi:microcin C transport system substrate-binding protein